MKTFTLVSFLFTLGYLNPANAQKAYNLINYQASVYGNKTTLQLADGYLLASKATIHSKFGDQVFSPQTNEADNQGNLQLSFVRGGGRFKGNKGSWMLLKNLNRSEYPLQISAVYWDGKMKKVVVFKQQTE